MLFLDVVMVLQGDAALQSHVACVEFTDQGSSDHAISDQIMLSQSTCALTTC